MREALSPPTVAEALREAAPTLAGVSDTARLDAEVLMAHALGVGRSDLLLRHMRDPAPPAFAPLAARRMAHEPVAYITGHQEFYGRDFRVTHDVLIPRGDSETLVNAALEAAPAPHRVLDCGTGSGALLLSVLAEREGAEGIGIDRSPAAFGLDGANHWFMPDIDDDAGIARPLGEGILFVSFSSLNNPAARAHTIEEILRETAATTISERGATRLDDQTHEASMEQRKREGYF